MLTFARRMVVPSILIVLAARAAGASLGDEGYSVPILNGYSVVRPTNDAPIDYQNPWLISSAGVSLVTHVQQIATSGSAIVGKAEDGYFIVDTSQPDGALKLYPDANTWCSALRASGVPAGTRLETLEALASRLPDQAVHPDSYRVMHAFLFLTDDAWSNLVLSICVIAMVLFGLYSRSLYVYLAAITLGIAVDFFAEVMVAGGGPGAIGGLITLPLFLCLVGAFGRWLRRKIPARARLGVGRPPGILDYSADGKRG
jgi:hypothetical protein